MKFEKITHELKVSPGEYILHKPTQQIVVCGAYKPEEGTIKAIVSGRIMEDKIENFKKIKLKRTQGKRGGVRRRGSCGKCGK